MAQDSASDWNRATSVYRFYSSTGELLYIGIAYDGTQRWRNHAAKKSWWSQVHRAEVEHFATRELAIAAETEQIRNLAPKYNVHHNSVVSMEPRSLGDWRSRGLSNMWEFESHASGVVRTTSLELVWEVRGDPITDNYDTSEVDAFDLWQMWRRDTPTDPEAEAYYGREHVFSIWWYVQGNGIFEFSPWPDCGPAQQSRSRYESGPGFLKHYTWPVHVENRGGLQWCHLPVVDKLWRPGRADKGGFIQELTGWKPAPFQEFVDMFQLRRMSGL